MIYRPRHFALHELVPPDIFEARGEAAWELLDTRLLIVLDRIRDFHGPVRVNDWYWGGNYSESGLRAPDSRTGAKYSQHKYGRAADLKFSRTTPRAVYERVLVHPEDYPGLTTLEDISATPTWLHVDVRNNSQPGIRIVRP